MKKTLLILSLTTILAGIARAEPVLLENKDNSLSLSIYNSDLALVKDIRPANLTTGGNEVIFNGVAEHIQAETAIIYGNGIKVNEQNYSYNLMSYDNLIKQYINKEVMTLRENPYNGEYISEDAVLIGYADGNPILQFEYGIDAAFPGHIVFPNVPAGLSNKPILTANLEVMQGGKQNLYLAYLTSGLSWKTDYVANVISEDKLDLTGWVTITNQSGIDYEKAKIQLVAGDVNTAHQVMRPMMLRSKGMVMGFNSMDMEASASITPESVNSYELYTLPRMVTLRNHQDKQISLIERKNVTYKKEFNLTSPLHFMNGYNNEFEKQHPLITYVVENSEHSNLGISLPSGTVRFYKNDSGNNLQFIGSDIIGNTAKEDTLRLNLGEAFNISVNGKIVNSKTKEVSRSIKNKCTEIRLLYTYDASITVNNAEDSDNTVVVKQNFSKDFNITKETIEGKNKNSKTRQWEISVPKNSKASLDFTVELTDTKLSCD